MFKIFNCHYCSVNAPANISALFLNRKWIIVILRRNSSRRSGQYWGVAVCSQVLHAGLHSCLVLSLGADLLTVVSIHVLES